MLTLDHLVISATQLGPGATEVEARLGLSLSPGGVHAAMGTHNRLLSLGASDYLEVIAIDPAAPAPQQARWYDLDRFSGPPRLTHWAARTDDLDAALAAAPAGCGTPWSLSRGDLAWRMAVPADGTLPFAGLFPALLEWQSDHPAPRLHDAGVRLSKLTLTSPEAATLRAALGPLADDPRLEMLTGSTPSISAVLDTPGGPVKL
ncbi:MAG: VOC family protein [Pseudomonadota bacterium]